MWTNWLDNFEFAWPWVLLLLLLVPLAALFRGKKGGNPSLAFPALAILGEESRARRNLVGWLIGAFFFLSIIVGIFALARPRLIKSYEKVKTEGVTIMAAIDVSRSMIEINDFFIDGRRTNRLVAAKRYLMDFIKGRPYDKIGICCFAGRAYMASPITLDHDWLLENMDRVDYGLVEDGTAIGSAIATSAKHLDTEKSPSKVIVLITDGANNIGNLTPAEAARLAATLNIRIYCIAVGTDMGRVRGNNNKEFGEDTLKEVARTGNGEYFHAQSTAALKEVFDTIDDLEKTEIEKKRIVETKELFPWVLGGSMVLFGLWLFSSQTFLRRCP